MMKEALIRFLCAMGAKTRVKAWWNEKTKDARKWIVVAIPPNFKMIC
jgi:hypothetical protein